MLYCIFYTKIMQNSSTNKKFCEIGWKRMPLFVIFHNNPREYGMVKEKRDGGEATAISWSVCFSLIC